MRTLLFIFTILSLVLIAGCSLKTAEAPVSEQLPGDLEEDTQELDAFDELQVEDFAVDVDELETIDF